MHLILVTVNAGAFSRTFPHSATTLYAFISNLSMPLCGLRGLLFRGRYTEELTGLHGAAVQEGVMAVAGRHVGSNRGEDHNQQEEWQPVLPQSWNGEEDE